MTGISEVGYKLLSINIRIFAYGTILSSNSFGMLTKRSQTYNYHQKRKELFLFRTSANFIEYLYEILNPLPEVWSAVDSTKICFISLGLKPHVILHQIRM